MTQGMTPDLDRSEKIRVLVVEDERVVARDIKACLESLGYTVSATATSGEEAIAKAKAIHPDIVLMDIRLEGEMDGTEAAQVIWDDLQIPIIYSSGYSDRATVERAIATEPFGYILKPIKERDLYVAVTTVVQRHQLEMKLKEREQWLTIILRSIGDGVIVVDNQQRVKFLNVVAEMLTGWRQEEAFNQLIETIFHLKHEHTGEPAPNPIVEVLQTGKIAHLADHTLLVAKDGTTIPIADSAAPFKNEDITVGAVLVFRDMTDQRLAQEQALTLQRAQMLERQMHELQRLNQLKDDFLSTISHELRTPLANIKMAIRMLEVTLDQQGEIDAKTNPALFQMSRYLEIVRDQCNQELSLVNDLLELQHLEADACPLEQTAVELKDWILHVMEVFEERAQRRQQWLRAILPPEMPVLVTDLAILTRILTELLMNAHKYTPPNETITVSTSVHDSCFHLKVCNTGVEIPAAELTRIFDKFYRIPADDRWSQGGTGLGLALIKRMVTYLNGSIWAESGSGQTCFTVELPLTVKTEVEG